MKLKFVCSLTAAAAMMSAAAFAQAGGSTTPALPSAPGTAPDPVAAAPAATGVKLAAINVEQAIFASNEGQRDFEALSKKLEPKQNQLKAQNDELDALKKKLTAATEADKGEIQRQVDTKQKALERDVQDAQEDARGQENEIAQRILGKMAPVIIKYASENGYGMIIDTSSNNQWPNGPVLWHGPALDITKAVVDAYNAQSGVPAPAKPTSGSAAPTHPAGTTTHPAGTTTKPVTTTPTGK